ncbi:ArsA family ATPase [Fusobacterium animalis]|uniref:ArsA family ATPase n=1 Tax=Fusobacterium animalis TaxID=76859 RepID=UPI0030CF594B
MARIIIFTGKGGVGKSSVAAAHALSSAKMDKKTLLVSADTAHNLGDIFKIQIGSKITKISENLDALELDSDVVKREIFPEVKNTMLDLMGKSGIEITNLNENFSLPGFENLFSLLKIKEIYETNQYEHILVDCAPTGETLALLKLPELLAWYMEKFFPIGKKIVRVLSPISKLAYKVVLPSAKTMNTIEHIHKKLLELQELLKNNEICSVRLVCIPEKMIVEETKRNFMYLNLYRYQVDTVFINRIITDEIENTFMQKWKKIQSKYIKELEEVFFDIPVVKIPWYPKEIVGETGLELLCNTIEKLPDLFSVKKVTQNEEYFPCKDGYLLKIQLPFVKEEELKIYHHEMDINIKINNVNRCIPLPNILRKSHIVDTKLENGNLYIHFQVEKKKEEKS